MLNNLTGLRFYTAFWVFLFHFGAYVFPIKNAFVLKGYLGVDIFFVLSGFILTYAYYDSFFLKKVNGKIYYNFILKRFAKIYPTHILTLGIIAVLVYTGKYIFHQKDLVIREDHLLSNLLMIHSWNINDALSWNKHSWSLSDEWFAYLFLFIISVFIVKKSKIFGVVFLWSVVIGFLIKWFCQADFDLDNYTYNGLERIIPEFTLGVCIGLLRMKVNLSKMASSFVFGISLLFFISIVLFNFKIDALCILAFAGIIFGLSYKTYFDRFFSAPKMVYLGNISFAFYMLQLTSFYLSKPIQSFLGNVLDSDFIRVTLELVFIFSLNLFLAAIIYQYYEEPIRKKIVDKWRK